jgi:hypothetical protein
MTTNELGNRTKIPETRRKMAEAQFFYRKLRDAAAQQSTEPPEAFGYYMSAFLSAAKSVITISIFELRGANALRRWRAGLREDGREFLELSWDQRDVEVHRLGVKIEKQTDWPGLEPEDDSWQSRLIPERWLLADGRSFGAIGAAGRCLGLLADLLNHVDKGVS